MSAGLVAAAIGMAGLLGADAALAARVNGPKVNWDLSTWGGKRTATAGTEELARLVAEATDGNFAIKIHYGETLGPIKEALDGLTVGAFSMAFTCTAYTPGKLPTFDGISLPFLPASTIEQLRAMREGFLTSPVPHKDAARWGISVVSALPASANEFMGKGKPPKSLADFKGMRLRAIGGDAAAMKLIGAVPQNMPLTEVYGGMERGLLDATGSVLSSLMSFKLQEVGTWFTTNMALSSASCLVLAGSKSMDGLPPQYRKLIMDSVPAVSDHWMAAYKTDDDAAATAFKAKGLVPVAMPESELDNLRQQVRPIWDAWVDQMDKLGYNGKELLQLILDSARKAKVS
ncbi:MAG: TRAP transporter substrate-binding protein DctP [Alphaproteobacteria bacterium]